MLEDLKNAKQVFNVPSSQIYKDQVIYGMKSVNSKKELYYYYSNISPFAVKL